jgi:hypothetical protein
MKNSFLKNMKAKRKIKKLKHENKELRKQLKLFKTTVNKEYKHVKLANPKDIPLDMYDI